MNKENSFRAVASSEIVLSKHYVFLSIMIQAFLGYETEWTLLFTAAAYGD